MGNVPSAEDSGRVPQKLSKHKPHKPRYYTEGFVSTPDVQGTPLSLPSPPSRPEDQHFGDGYYSTNPSQEVRYGTTTLVTAESNVSDGMKDGGLGLIRRISRRTSQKNSSTKQHANSPALEHNGTQTQNQNSFRSRAEREESRPNVVRAGTSPSLRPPPWTSSEEDDANAKRQPWSGSTGHTDENRDLRPSYNTRVRRTSLTHVPGVATRTQEPTRVLSKPKLRKQERLSYQDSSEAGKGSSRPKHLRHLSMPLVPLTADPIQRAATPNDTEYGPLGVMKFGSLHITNGAPSPAPSDRDSIKSSLRRSTAPKGLSSTVHGLEFGFDEQKVLLPPRPTTTYPQELPESSLVSPDLSQGDGDHLFSTTSPGDYPTPKTCSDSGYSSFGSPRRGSNSPTEEGYKLADTLTSMAIDNEPSKTNSPQESDLSTGQASPAEYDEEDQPRGRSLHSLTRRLSSISLHISRAKVEG